MEGQSINVSERNLPSVVLASEGVCKFWLNGFCKTGINCPMQHPEDNNSSFYDINSKGSISLLAPSVEDQEDIESEQSEMALRPSSAAASASSSTTTSSHSSPTSTSPSPHTDNNDTTSDNYVQHKNSGDPGPSQSGNPDEDDQAGDAQVDQDDETASNTSELSAKDIAVGAGADESKIQEILAGLKAPTSEALMSMIASTDKWVTSVVRVHQRLRTALNTDEDDGEEDDNTGNPVSKRNPNNGGGRGRRQGNANSSNNGSNGNNSNRPSQPRGRGSRGSSGGASPVMNESARRRGSGGSASSRAKSGQPQPAVSQHTQSRNSSGVVSPVGGISSESTAGGPVKLSDKPPALTETAAPKVFVTRSQKTVVKKDRSSGSRDMTATGPPASNPPSSSSSQLSSSQSSSIPPICQNIRFGITCRPDCPFTHPSASATSATSAASALSSSTSSSNASSAADASSVTPTGLVVTRTGDSRSVRPVIPAAGISPATSSPPLVVTTTVKASQPAGVDTDNARPRRVIVVKKKE